MLHHVCFSFPILKKRSTILQKILADLFFKTGKEKQTRGKEKQTRGKEKQPLNLFFPCLKKKVDGISKLKAGQGRMTKILVNFCMEPRSIIEQKKENHIYHSRKMLSGTSTDSRKLSCSRATALEQEKTSSQSLCQKAYFPVYDSNSYDRYGFLFLKVF